MPYAYDGMTRSTTILLLGMNIGLRSVVLPGAEHRTACVVLPGTGCFRRTLPLMKRLQQLHKLPSHASLAMRMQA